MKSCPICQRLFEDEASFCPEDGSELLRTTLVPLSPSDDPRIGSLVCMRYEIRRFVADGGMGRVYEALDMQTRERVAVKVLHADVARDEIAVERFKREFEVSKLLPHDHIVDVKDLQRTEDGSYAIMMEFLDGEELRMTLKREVRIPPERVVRMLSQVALGLDEAHRRNLVHRDLKPDNIFLCGTREGDVTKILDFGSVKDKSSSAKKLTVMGTTIGSPFYMAPEQAQGLDSLDARADVWALAAIAYECLTGSVPFKGNNGPSILLAILTTDPKPPTVAVAGAGSPIPFSIDEVMEHALAKNPNIRIPTVGALADALGHAYGLSGQHAAWASTPQQELRDQIQLALPALLAQPPVAVRVATLSSAEQAPLSANPNSDFVMGLPPKRPRWMLAALVGALATIAGVVAAVLLSR